LLGTAVAALNYEIVKQGGSKIKSPGQCTRD
jgi:hypothetical protein